MLFFAEIITLLVVKMNCYYHDCLNSTDEQHYLQRDVTEAEMFRVSGSDAIDGTYNSRQARGLLDEIGSALLSILQTDNGTF